jgi:hypothetical protein
VIVNEFRTAGLNRGYGKGVVATPAISGWRLLPGRGSRRGMTMSPNRIEASASRPRSSRIPGLAYSPIMWFSTETGPPSKIGLHSNIKLVYTLIIDENEHHGGVPHRRRSRPHRNWNSHRQIKPLMYARVGSPFDAEASHGA